MKLRLSMLITVFGAGLVSVSFFNCAKTDNSALLAQKAQSSSAGNSQNSSVDDSGQTVPQVGSSASPSPSSTPGGSASATPTATPTGVPTASPTSSPSPTATASPSCDYSISTNSFVVTSEALTVSAIGLHGVRWISMTCGSQSYPDIIDLTVSGNRTFPPNSFPASGNLNCRFTGRTQTNVTTTCGAADSMINFKAAATSCAPQDVPDLFCTVAGVNVNAKAMVNITGNIGDSINWDYTGPSRVQPSVTNFSLKDYSFRDYYPTRLRLNWQCKEDGKWTWTLGNQGLCAVNRR